MSDKKLASLIDIAIDREIQAHDFYKGLADRIEDPTVKDTLTFFSRGRNKNAGNFWKATGRDFTNRIVARLTDVVDYKIAEHLEEPDTTKDMNSAEVYLVAAHRELQSCRFYRALADLHPDSEARTMLLRMAQKR